MVVSIVILESSLGLRHHTPPNSHRYIRIYYLETQKFFSCIANITESYSSITVVRFIGENLGWPREELNKSFSREVVVSSRY